MSMTIFASNPSDGDTTDLRASWGRLFGQLIQGSREKKGFSVADLAQLAGMEAVAWEAVEAGQVPGSLEELKTVAAALEMEWVAMAELVLLCQDAWAI